MRLINIFAALSAVAGITSAFPSIDTRSNDVHDVVDRDAGVPNANAGRFAADIPFTDTAILRERATTKGTTTKGTTKSGSKKPPCGMKKRRGLSRRTGGNAEWYDDEFWIMESEVCPATLNNGQPLAVMDVSGCTGLFFFTSDGKKTSAYHITAGKESSEVATAISSAKAAGTTALYSIYAASQSKVSEIEKIILGSASLSGIKKHETQTYALNMGDRLERWKMANKPGSMTVAVSKYTCE